MDDRTDDDILPPEQPVLCDACCAMCGRWITDQNPAAGRSCLGCLTEWIEQLPHPDDLTAAEPVAFVRTGESWCAACGTETVAGDLCVRCDDFARDPGRPY